jgi:FkbM family methyltransferase
VIVAGLLRARLLTQNRTMNSVFYIEIGANHPISTSNTYLLYERYKASGLLVEANPALIDDLRRVRPRDQVVEAAVSTSSDDKALLHVANSSELSSLNAGHVNSFGPLQGRGGIAQTIMVPNIHINDLLLVGAAGAAFDFLAIDCEGLDYDLLCAMDFERFKPFIIQCEPSAHFVHDNKARIIGLLQSRSYRLTAVTNVNLIFMYAL